jgi:hypothetical protein
MRRKLLLVLITLLLSSCYPFINNSIYVDSPPIKIPNLYLKSFPKEKRDVLLNYLASSSDWHVTTVNGSLLALNREEFKSSCERPIMLGLPSQYYSGEIPFTLDGLIFIFSPEVGMSRSVEPENRVKENETVSLKMEKMKPPYGNSYRLIVENQDKSLELFQGGNSEDFQNKQLYNKLTGISRKLEKLAKSTSMNSQEIDPSILPPGSVKYSRNQIISIKRDNDISPSPTHNYHIVSGYINLGKRGFVYVKAIRKEDGKLLLSEQTSTNAEYVGWSANLNRKFKFCIEIEPDGGASTKLDYLADIQIWFHPSDGSPEIMLHQKTSRLNTDRDQLKPSGS